jgi:hypothetical protein
MAGYEVGNTSYEGKIRAIRINVAIHQCTDVAI